jgi:hypothetical protein
VATRIRTEALAGDVAFALLFKTAGRAGEFICFFLVLFLMLVFGVCFVACFFACFFTWFPYGSLEVNLRAIYTSKNIFYELRDVIERQASGRQEAVVYDCQPKQDFAALFGRLVVPSNPRRVRLAENDLVSVIQSTLDMFVGS